MKAAVRSTVVPMTSPTQRAFARLLKWDIPTIKQYAVQKGLYTAEEIDAVEIEYKKYLALCIGYPQAALPTPLRLDDLWHQHILFTKDYHAMCQKVCGTYLHHQPFVGDAKADPRARSEMRAIYQREFGEPPANAWGNCFVNPCSVGTCEGACEPGGGDPG